VKTPDDDGFVVQNTIHVDFINLENPKAGWIQPGLVERDVALEVIVGRHVLLLMIVMWERAMWERIIISVEAKTVRLNEVLQDKMTFQDEARAAAQRYGDGDPSKSDVSGLLDA
jgi:hypothetical protein